MSELPPFNTFYQHKLAAKMDELEIQRAEIYRKSTLGAVSLIIGGVLMIVIPIIGLVFMIIGVIIGIVFSYQAYKTHKIWYRAFKEGVIRSIITHVSPQLQYFPKQKMPLAEFRHSKLFLQKAHRYHGDDFIQGKIDSTNLACSELFVQHRQQSGKNTHYVTIFKGLFAKTDFNKHFQGETFVLPDTAEKLFGGFGRWLQSLNFARPDRVQLEDPDFEQTFAVYSTDQVEARYILTPSLMERIMNLRQMTGQNVALSFVNNHMYLGLSSNKKLLEPSLFKKMNDPEKVREYYEDIRLVVSIVEELNLNLRIWTRE